MYSKRILYKTPQNYAIGCIPEHFAHWTQILICQFNSTFTSLSILTPWWFFQHSQITHLAITS